MSNEQIIEGNKLIADFVGLRFRSVQCGNPMSGIDYDWEADCPDFIDHDEQLIPLYDKDRPEEHFKFHSDWNWLIPAWGKIARSYRDVVAKPNTTHDEVKNTYIRPLDAFESAVFNNTPQEAFKVAVTMLERLAAPKSPSHV